MNTNAFTPAQLRQIVEHINANPVIALGQAIVDNEAQRASDETLLHYFYNDTCPADCGQNEQYVKALNIVSRNLEIGLEKAFVEITRDDMIAYFMQCITKDPESSVFEFKHDLLTYLCDEAMETIMSGPYFHKHYPLYETSERYDADEIEPTCTLSETFRNGKLQTVTLTYLSSYSHLKLNTYNNSYY
jgi:hypothetical protein